LHWHEPIQLNFINPTTTVPKSPKQFEPWISNQPMSSLFRNLSASIGLTLFTIVHAAAQAYNWRTVEIGGTGFVTGTVFHPTEPGLVYARTDVGGTYRLDTTNNRWIALNDDVGGINNEFQHLGVQTIALDPNDANRIYIATGQYSGTESWKLNSRIYRSTDRGATWTFTTPGFKMAGNGEGRGTGERMVVDPLNSANLLVGSNNLGIWRSTDFGATWTRLTSFPSTLTNLNFLLYAPTTASGPGPNRRLYAAANTLTGQSFWFSDNNGTSWAEVANHPGKTIGGEMMPLQGSFDAAGVFYSTWGNATGPGNFASNYGVWKWSADGNTWTSILPPTGQGFFGGISADPRLPGHVVVSTLLRWWPGDEVYRSTDGGSTWTAALRTATKSLGNSPWATPTPHWMTDIDIDPFNSNRAIFNTGFGLFQTTNLAATGTTRTWTFFNDGLEESVPLGLHSPTAGPPLVSVIGDYTGFRHDDLNRSPLRGALNPGSGSTNVITGADLAPSRMIRQNSGTTLYSQDAAATWATFPTTPAPIINGHNRVILSTDGQRLLWCPPNSPAYLSTNNGSSWTISTTSLSLTNSNNTQSVAILAGAAATPGTTNASGGNARFNSPTAIALDPSGNSYVTDTANHTIRRIAARGAVSTFAGSPEIPGTTDASGANARFNSPTGIAVDSAGIVYVADTGNHTIRRITAAGAVTTLAGSAGLPGSTDASGSAARFNSPAGLAVDTSGNVFVCDAGNHTIRRITPAGLVTTVAGSPGLVGTTNANGSSARFNSPRGITVDSSGNLIVTDTGNHAIRRITTNGDVTTFAGLSGTPGSTDASTGTARFNSPMAVTIDGAGTFHVADTGNHTVRRITSAGVVTTVAGLAGSAGSANGSGTTARFSTPSGIVTTPDGFNIYVADTNNHTIRRNTLYNTLTPLADRVDPLRFYLWDGTAKRIFTSTDGGLTFSVIASGVNTTFTGFHTVPGHNGHIWVRAEDSGLFRSTNFGATFTKLNAVASTYRVAFGRAKPGNTHPAVYIWGRIGTTVGFFRSDDTGVTWTRINDNLHNFGYQNDLAGDPRVYGRVYLATSGRGVVVGEIANPPLPPSQASQTVYADSLSGDWSNSSPTGTSLTSTNPVRRGTNAISITSGTGRGLALTCTSRSLEGFAALAFWISAGASSPPPLQVGASRGGIPLEAAPITVPSTVGWQRVVVPFTSIGISNITDLSGLRIESRVVNGVTPGAFSIDDVELVGNDEFNGTSTATITLTNVSQTYNGSPRPVTATTIPAGLPVLLTYNGSPTPPTAVGSYAVSAVIDDPAVIGSANGTLVISKANASILLGNLSPAADGTPKAPTVTTTPPGLAVSLTYNGSATVPSLAGSYTVVASVTDPNYQGDTTSTLLIRQLALPATGINNWASNIAGKVTASTTSSPLLNPNDTTDGFSTNTLQANFKPITLANTNDKITLTGNLQMTLAGVSGQGNWFRFGLYDNRGQAPEIITGWLGLTAMGMATPATVWERTGTTGYFSSGTGANSRTVNTSPSPVGSTSPSGTPPLTFRIDITRTAGGILSTYLLQRTDSVPATTLLSYSYTDTTPNNNGVLTGDQTTPNGYIPTYTTAGFAFSRSYIASTGAQAQFSNIQIAFTPGITAEPQTIAFPPIADRTITSPALALTATSSSGLPVTYQIVSGPATLAGNTLTPTGLGTITVRASQSGNLNFLPAPDVDQTFTITKAPATVTLGSLSPTYDGTPKSVTTTTNPPSLTTIITYDGSTTPPTNAGNYAVVATINDPTYQGSATATLVIGKATQAITFAPPANRVFGDEPFNLSATIGSPLPITFSLLGGPATLSGATLTLTGAGTVTVSASQAGDANHFAATAVERSFTVAKAPALVTFGNLNSPYDGLAKTVSVTTAPAGLLVAITYNGSPTAPFAPGSYAVSATVDDPDYAGSASGTLVIGNRGFTTDLTGWFTTSSTLSSANTSSPRWNPNNTNSGLNGSTHAFFPAIQLTGVGDSIQLTGSIAVQINNNSRPVQNIGRWFRFGLFQSPTPLAPPAAPVTTDWRGYCAMASSTRDLFERTATGAYASSITGATSRIPQTSANGLNSTQNSITLQFTETITRTATGVDVAFDAFNTANNAKVISHTFSDTTPNNNGLLGSDQTTATNHSPTFSAAGFGFSGEYIGTSNAAAQFTNVQISYSSPSPGTSQSLTFAPIEDRVFGAAAIPLAATSSSGLPVSYTVVSGQATLADNTLTITGVGEITVRASQVGNINFLPAVPIERSFTVTKAPATVTLGNLSHVYDGSAKSAAVTTTPAGLTVDLRYNGQQTAPLMVGSYEVTAVVADDDYEGAASATLIISAIPQTLTFNPLPDKTFGDAPFPLTATASSGLPVSFNILSGPATLAGATLTITGSGTVTIRASQAGDETRAAAPDQDRSFTVAKAPATVTLGNLSHVYDGSAKSAAVTTTPAGLTVDLRYNGQQTAPLMVGSYEVTAVVADDDYEGGASATLIISAIPQTLTFNPLPDKTFGDAPFPLTATASSGLPVSFNILSGPATLAGATLTITGSGTVTIRASQAGDETRAAAPDQDRSFTVAKAPATVTLGNLTATYDGTPKAATSVTNPSGLLVVKTYNGSSTEPIAAGSYTVNATVVDADHHGSASATLVIIDLKTPHEDWRFTHFQTYDNQGNAADSADPDHDGIVNLTEFALGLDPKSPSTIPATLTLANGSMQFTYTRLIAAVAEINFSVEQSTELSTNHWTTLGVGSESLPFASDGTRHSVTVTIPATGTKRFVRLKLTPKQP
jgi:sugar lactone lactonase YvrE